MCERCSFQADDAAAAAGGYDSSGPTMPLADRRPRRSDEFQSSSAADYDAAAGGGYDSAGRRRRGGRPYDDVDYADDEVPRTASRLAAGRGTPGQGLDSPGSPQIVALNETGQGPSRIGATLYQAPSPHSGFTATQNVVSSSAVRPVDVDQVSV